MPRGAGGANTSSAGSVVREDSRDEARVDGLSRGIAKTEGGEKMKIKTNVKAGGGNVKLS